MLFILILGFFAALFIWLQFRSKRMSVGRHARLKGKQPTERTLFNIQIGDVVQYQERDWILETIYRYQQHQFECIEYLLRDNDDAAWLVVVEDDWLEVSWLTPVPEDQLRLSLPLPNVIDYEGISYLLKERGEAKYSTEGRVNNQKGNCTFYDYQTVQGFKLSFELYGSDEDGELDVNIGRKIKSQDLSILPGDGQSVYANISR